VRLDVWILLPTYNEATNIERMIGALSGLPGGLRLLVVDDASPDGTGAIAEERARELGNLRVIHRSERGLGTAYQKGFREALAGGAEAVLTMDCDFSHDPRHVPELLAALPQADLVIGSRYIPGGSVDGWAWHRRLLSRVANRFVHTLFHLPVEDCTSGFRLYRSEVLEAIPWDRVRSTGYSFLVESLLWAARQESVRIVEVPICFRDRGRGKSKLGWTEALNGAVNLTRLWLEEPRSRGPRRDCPAPPRGW
jgi:dolichol-phosphate mannosyltransferase